MTRLERVVTLAGTAALCVLVLWLITLQLDSDRAFNPPPSPPTSVGPFVRSTP